MSLYPLASPIVGTGPPVHDTRRTAVLVGSMFLGATLTFMIGDRLISSVFESGVAPVDASALTIGVGLIAACGVAVAVIGVALFRVLRRFDSRLAWGQMAFRLLEWATIWGVGGYMLATHEPVPYEVATYVFTGTAGLIATYALGRHGLIPGLVARLGIVGYVAIVGTVPSGSSTSCPSIRRSGCSSTCLAPVFQPMLPVLRNHRRRFPPVGGDLDRHSSARIL